MDDVKARGHAEAASLSRQPGADRALLLPVAGLGLGVAATAGWGQSGFGNLAPERTMPLAIPSATLILLAVSTASMAFFLSFLRLIRRSG